MIEHNSKLGYYRVGNRIFYLKPDAYIYATQTGELPDWQFNPIEFAKFNWESEPETNLRELYRQRAQQLRDRYDYIRLECSGGGDSATALFSFLLNGIHIDEVMFRYPKQVDKDSVDAPWNTRAENTLGERKYAAEPLLHWIKTNYPQVKITIQDYSENLLKDDYLRDESWVFTTRDWFQPGHGIKFGNFNTQEQRKLADSNKKICVLHGIDKPKLAVIDNKWYLYFMDLQANNPCPIIGDHTNITTELFYWTPDLPELVAKQAHIIKTWFDMPHNRHIGHLVQGIQGSPARRTAYEQVIKSIIYPDYDVETWQTVKPTNSFYNEMDHWFYTNLTGTNLYSAWESGLNFLLHKIDPKYFTYELGKPVGLNINCSTLYYLGPSTAELNQPGFINRDYLTQSNKIAVENKKLKVVKI